MQKQRVIVALAVALVVMVAGCAEVEPQTIEVTREVEVPQIVEVTREVTRQVTQVVQEVVTEEVEVTRLVTVAPTPTATSAVSVDEKFAANYVATQEQGGVRIELTRVLCMSREAFQEERDISDEQWEEEGKPWFGDPKSMCEFVLTVKNDSGGVRNIYPDQADVIIGNEQIDLLSASLPIPSWEDVSGELQPGVVRIGGFWFSVKRAEVSEIDQVTYIIDPPSDADYSSHGSEFRFEFSTEGWGFEPLPEDL
jgi:hypothetical protein